jgi:hypothetical protein
MQLLHFYTLVAFSLLSTVNTDLGIGVALAGSPPVSSILLSLSLCRPIHTWSTRTRNPASVPRHQLETVHQQFGVICGNVDSQSLLSHLKFDMVNTRSSHQLQPPPSAPRVSNNPELMEFLKNMAESMEVLRKQNEDLNIGSLRLKL